MSAPASPEVARALLTCYDALVVPDAWTEALDRLAYAIGVKGCLFRARETERAILELPISPGVRNFTDEFVRDGWWRHDDRAERGWPLMIARGGGVLIDEDLCSDEERQQLPFYSDFSRHHDLPHWAGVGFRVDGNYWVMTLLREAERGPFGRREAEQLASLAPHFRRLVTFANGFATSQAEIALNTLDQIGRGIVLLDRFGRVRRLNEAATAHIGADLRIVDGVLVTGHGPTDRKLRALIAAAVAPNMLPGECTHGFVAVQREGKRPLVVDAMPVSGLFADIFQLYGAILLITDLDTHPPMKESRLNRIFGLTPAESRLAARLAGGDELGGAAGALGITPGTARYQLKSVFAKTGTHRQAELVALLGRLGDQA